MAQNDFLIGLVSGLDPTKSKSQINSDIENLKKSLDDVELKAKLDPQQVSNIKDQLEKLQINLNDVKFSQTALNGLVTQINDALKGIQIPNINIGGNGTGTGGNIGQVISQQVQDSINKVSSPEIEVGFHINPNDSANFTNEVNQIIKNLQSENATAISYKLNTDTVFDDNTNQYIEKLNSAVFRYTTATGEAISKTYAFDEAQKVWVEQSAAYSNSMKKNTDATTKFISETTRLNNVKSWQQWADNNSKAMKKYGDRINEIINKMGDLNVSMSRVEADKLINEMKQIQIAARQTGNIGATVFDKLGKAWEKFGGWSIATGTLMKSINSARQMVDEVKKIDTAMTNLYKVTDETDYRYNKFLDTACDNAQRLGRSVSSLIEQSANWAKLGYNINESEQLAQVSSIYANVGEVDDATAVSDMVTAMKAFNIEASDAITIVNKYNKLGNEFATSAKALGDGLARSASAMASAGTDINKTLAMLTGGSEITQNASEFGNFLKVSSMRIRGMKGQLEELGETVDDTVDSISKVQTQILNRTGGKVNIFNDIGNFRDYYDIMMDISKVYNDLSDPDKADLTEILFGKQRGNQGAALIQAFQSGQIQKALNATLNADNSAMQEQERWLDSIEAKTQQLDAAFQSLSNTVVNSNFLKTLTDGAIGLTNALDFIIDKTGVLMPLLSGTAVVAFVKNFD